MSLNNFDTKSVQKSWQNYARTFLVATKKCEISPNIGEVCKNMPPCRKMFQLKDHKFKFIRIFIVKMSRAAPVWISQDMLL